MIKYSKTNKDANHNRIVAGLRAAGCSVLDLSAVGDGCPDILVGVSGHNILFEIKDGEKVKSQTKLNDRQIEFFDSWRGTAYVVKSLLEAIRIINDYRSC